MTSLVPYSLMTEIISSRAAALKKMEEAVATIRDGHAAADEAQSLAMKAHGGTHFYLQQRDKTNTYQRIFQSFDADASMKVYRQHLDSCIWTSLIDRTGIGAMMDKTAKDALYRDICSDDVPEATEENIAATFERLAGEAHLIFQRGLARAFIELDRRFKSHDGFKIGSRVILTHVFDQWGSFNFHSRMGETMVDIERVFAVLDGNRPALVSSLTDQVRRDRGHGIAPRQSETVTDYFRVRCYKNGNAHLWFTRDDLVEKANKVLADYYGEVLPDGVHRTTSEKDLRSKTTAMAKDLSFYPTPDAIVDTVLRDLYIPEGARVLEPSAGTGAFVRGLLERKVGRINAVEVDEARVTVLKTIRDGRLNVTHANFLQMGAAPLFDLVVMNPPFYGTHWMEHVVHAFDFLAPGGTLVSILPISAETGESAKHEEFRKWAEARKRDHRLFYDLPPESFAESGTRINTVYIQLRKDK